MIECKEEGGALFFTVRVVPRASKSSIAGERDGALRVRVAAPPVEGAANEELTRLLAQALGFYSVKPLLITTSLFTASSQ